MSVQTIASLDGDVAGPSRCSKRVGDIVHGEWYSLSLGTTVVASCCSVLANQSVEAKTLT